MEIEDENTIPIDKTMFDNSNDQYEQIEYAEREKLFNQNEQKSFLLQLIEQVTKIVNRIRTIDTEYHEIRSQVLKREQSLPVKYPRGFPSSFDAD